MHSRLRIAGQGIQPVLVMFPLGLFAMAVLFDLADLLGAPDLIGALAYWNIVAGLVGGVLAALACAVDLMLQRVSPAVKRVGVLQGLFNMGVLFVFAVVLILRMRTPDRVAGGGLFAVELFALGASIFGAWYFGKLTDGYAHAPARLATTARPAGSGRADRPARPAAAAAPWVAARPEPIRPTPARGSSAPWVAARPEPIRPTPARKASAQWDEARPEPMRSAPARKAPGRHSAAKQRPAAQPRATAQPRPTASRTPA